MRCAYLTLDEVNRDLAGNLAGALGMGLDILSLRDAAPDGQFDAIVYDLDFLPRDDRERVLARLRARRATEPVAVHSYHLSDRHKSLLRRRGVIVARRLSPQLFALLQAACQRATDVPGRYLARKGD
jgi:hypothetical protein